MSWSQGGQVGYSPDFHLDGPDRPPPEVTNKRKRRLKKEKTHLVCLKNDLMSQGVLKNILIKTYV